MDGGRIILLCDCNNFFASCEMLERPELRHVPMAVAGDPERRTGVVVAKNELAKKYGVKTTDTLYAAKRKCPDIVFVPPRHDYYEQVSRKVNAIYREYTDLVEPASIDESYMDVSVYTGGSWRDAEALADELRDRVRGEIGVTISVGVSFCKVFAKMGSEMKKPDGTTVIGPGDFRDVIWPRPATDLLYVGRSAGDILKKHDIFTVGDLARADAELLERLLGKGGEGLRRCAAGLDDAPVRRWDQREEIKSVSRGMTFRRDLVAEEEVRAGLSALCDDVATQLRRSGMKGSVVQLQIKTPRLTTVSRQVSLPYCVCTRHEILDAAMELIGANWRVGPDDPIRALTVGVTHLIRAGEASEQTSLFDLIDGGEPHSRAAREKQERLEAAVDRIRSKHGASAISAGWNGGDDLGIGEYRRKT